MNTGMKPGKEKIRKYLQNELISNHLFWSYDDIKPEQVEDDILIEKVLLYLDLDDINKLFNIYPYRKIREIWMNSMFIRDPMNRSLNLLLAYLYFNIKEPEKLLDEVVEDHLQQLR